MYNLEAIGVYSLLFIIFSLMYSVIASLILNAFESGIFDYPYDTFKRNFPKRKKRILLLLIGGIIPIFIYFIMFISDFEIKMKFNLNLNLNYFKK